MEWVTDGNQSLNGERQHKERFQSSCSGRDDVSDNDEVPGLLKLLQHPAPRRHDESDQQVDGVVDCQTAEVDCRRVLANDARSQPDERRQDVACEIYQSLLCLKKRAIFGKL